MGLPRLSNQTFVASAAEETVPLEAPEADALGLELAAFVAAVRGEPAAIVSAAEGRGALALALDVTAAVQRAPVPALGR